MGDIRIEIDLGKGKGDIRISCVGKIIDNGILEILKTVISRLPLLKSQEKESSDKVEDEIRKFIEWLTKHTELKKDTIKSYARTLRRYLTNSEFTTFDKTHLSTVLKHYNKFKEEVK